MQIFQNAQNAVPLNPYVESHLDIIFIWSIIEQRILHISLEMV
jgi:hypothetical protein